MQAVDVRRRDDGEGAVVTPGVKPKVMKYFLYKAGPAKPLLNKVKFNDGVGIRAVAHGSAESDFTHMVAIEAESIAAVGVLEKSLAMNSSATSFSACVTPDCIALLEMIKSTRPPSYMPEFKVVVFVCIEFEVSVGEKRPPKVALTCEGRAAIVNKGGKRLLLELGTNTGATVRADLAKLRSWKGTKSVRVLHTGPDSMKRALP